jgi:hypothetical protein
MDVPDRTRGASSCSSRRLKLHGLWFAALTFVQEICLLALISMIPGLKEDTVDLLIVAVASQVRMLAVELCLLLHTVGAQYALAKAR